ncbi:unnamed protein product [Gordionus sp. m RMFG-2023]
MKTYKLVVFGILVLTLGINTQKQVLDGISENSDTCILDLGNETYTFSPGEIITPKTQCMGCTCQNVGNDSQYSCLGCNETEKLPLYSGCTPVGFKGEPHPDCCPANICS